MHIIKRYGRKCPHCSRETQGLERGCIASARHYDVKHVFINLILGPGGILACTRVVSGLFVGSRIEYCRHREMRPDSQSQDFCYSKNLAITAQIFHVFYNMAHGYQLLTSRELGQLSCKAYRIPLPEHAKNVPFQAVYHLLGGLRKCVAIFWCRVLGRTLRAPFQGCLYESVAPRAY